MIEPAGFRVLLELQLEETSTKSNVIALPEAITKRETLGTEKGKVISMGDLAFKAWGDGAPWVNVGDLVYFVRYSGKEIRRDDKIFRVVNDEDIYAREVDNEQ
jgi:co-chaperonin GroES (HSP10)